MREVGHVNKAKKEKRIMVKATTTTLLGSPTPPTHSNYFVKETSAISSLKISLESTGVTSS